MSGNNIYGYVNLR